MIWKLLLVAERNFRRIKVPELIAKVADGERYENGVETQSETPQVEYKQAA